MFREERIQTWAEARGYALATAGVRVVEAARQALEEQRDAGMIERGFFQECLGFFRYLDDCGIAGPRRVVLVAVPRPIHVLPFWAGGERIEGLIPPTYVRYRLLFEEVLADLKENALGLDCEAELLKAPLKSLATHAGLVQVGRNSLTYVPGRGSGHQLLGFVVSLEGQPEEDRPVWHEEPLPQCASCRACAKACPTGAIREDRFLIAGERCYTYHSERREPIPAWVRPPRRLCLVGCMACQEVCPENKGRLRTEPSGVELSAEESDAVLRLGRGEPGGSALESARAKIERLGLTDCLEVVARNLVYCLSRRRRGSRMKGE